MIMTPEMQAQMHLLFYVRLGLFAFLAIACAYTDMSRGKVYNSITLPMIPLALLVRFMDPALGPMASGHSLFVQQGLVGAAMCFIVFFVIWVIGALSGKPLMGGGDVKLMTAIGALMGPQFSAWVIFYSVMVGFVMSIYVLFTHGEVWAGLVGAFRRLVWPSHPAEVSEVERRATSRTISFCTAICVGGLLTLFWHPSIVFFS